MELKFLHVVVEIERVERSNRTFMELKLENLIKVII